MQIKSIFSTDSSILHRAVEISLGNSGEELQSNVYHNALPYRVQAFIPEEIMRNHFHAAADLFPFAASKARCLITSEIIK